MPRESGSIKARPGLADHLGMATPDSLQIELLRMAEERDGAIYHEASGVRERLDLSRVQHAVAAEVGEPEGIRTVVFDLLLDGPGGRVWRLDADPLVGAMELARAIERSIGKERCAASLLSLATDGLTTQSFPDLHSYEEEVLSSLERG